MRLFRLVTRMAHLAGDTEREAVGYSALATHQRREMAHLVRSDYRKEGPLGEIAGSTAKLVAVGIQSRRRTEIR